MSGAIVLCGIVTGVAQRPEEHRLNEARDTGAPEHTAQSHRSYRGRCDSLTSTALPQTVALPPAVEAAVSPPPPPMPMTEQDPSAAESGGAAAARSVEHTHTHRHTHTRTGRSCRRLWFACIISCGISRFRLEINAISDKVVLNSAVRTEAARCGIDVSRVSGG